LTIPGIKEEKAMNRICLMPSKHKEKVKKLNPTPQNPKAVELNV
jgi:hypothetical protein